MSERQGWLRNNGYVIAFSSLSFFLYLALFFLRSFDDNRTTSWHNVFTFSNPAIVFSLMVICVMAAWLLSRLSLIGRHPSFFLPVFLLRSQLLSGMSLKSLLMLQGIFCRQSILSCMEWGFSQGVGKGHCCMDRPADCAFFLRADL